LGVCKCPTNRNQTHLLGLDALLGHLATQYADLGQHDRILFLLALALRTIKRLNELFKSLSCANDCTSPMPLTNCIEETKRLRKNWQDQVMQLVGRKNEHQRNLSTSAHHRPLLWFLIVPSVDRCNMKSKS
jgi:hypothetical protein